MLRGKYLVRQWQDIRCQGSVRPRSYLGDIDFACVALYKGGSSQSSYVLLSLRLMGVLYSLHDGLIDTFKFLLNSSTYKVNIK